MADPVLAFILAAAFFLAITAASWFRTLDAALWREARVPLIAGAIAVAFTVLGVIGGSVLFNKYAVRDHDGINLEMTGDMARAGQIGDAALAGGLGIVCLVFVFVVFFYALGSQALARLVVGFIEQTA